MIRPPQLPGPRRPGQGGPQEPYPDLRSAFLLTVLAFVATLFTALLFFGLGPLVALGVGQAIGVGAVATMAAQRVPEPQAERLGLRALDTSAIPLILCLVPAILLASELDNIAADFSGADPSAIERSTVDAETEAVDGEERTRETVEPEFGGDIPEDSPSEERVPGAREEDEELARIFDANDPWSMLQLVIVMIGIAPVVEEFLFRGVIQQGLIRRMGLLQGIGFAALLSTLARPHQLGDPARWLVAMLSFLALGCLLGLVRIATRSILGPVLLTSSWAAVGVLALAWAGEFDLPGLNVEGTHLPPQITLVSTIVVAWASWTLYAEALRRYDAERDGPGARGEGGEGGRGGGAGLSGRAVEPPAPIPIDRARRRR